MELTIEHLINNFKRAKRNCSHYIGVFIEMEGFNNPEVIINSFENFDKKLAYYIDAYDENLNHKHAKGIKIVGFTYGDYFSEIEADLM